MGLVYLLDESWETIHMQHPLPKLFKLPDGTYYKKTLKVDVSGMTSKQKWHMCGRKRDYRSWECAEKAAKRFGQKYYECPICFCFHLTKAK